MSDKTTPDDIQGYMTQVGERAKTAARVLTSAPTSVKDHALNAIADTLVENRISVEEANAKDLAAGKQQGLSSALLDRLSLTAARINSMAQGLQQVAALPDPIGEITDLKYRPSGIQVGRMRVPLGVIGIIYESRPNVTADAAGLCLKSGNATILRGGSEAINSNQAIAACIRHGLENVGLPMDAVQVVETTDRAAVGELIRMDRYVDIIVPRGGKGLIKRVSEEATIPVIKHLDGICHVYIDDRADIEKAIEIAFNAKTQRYATCCTMETLLVAEGVAEQVLPRLSQRYIGENVEIRGCPQTLALVPNAIPATEEDWDTEYLAPIVSIRILPDLTSAIDHIERHGSQHTDSIVTEDLSRSRRFLTEVDSSSVMVNASTRFADGFEYGLGAEIGISTGKLHARGPVALEGLTSQKFVVFGDGQIRQ